MRKIILGGLTALTLGAGCATTMSHQDIRRAEYLDIYGNSVQEVRTDDGVFRHILYPGGSCMDELVDNLRYIVYRDFNCDETVDFMQTIEGDFHLNCLSITERIRCARMNREYRQLKDDLLSQ